MENKWDERYSQTEYIYGIEPNKFFKEVISDMSPGKILLPAEGEGRNAVFAASMGWDVHAIDYSKEGRSKAIRLAELNRVSINYEIIQIEEYRTNQKFDLIGLFFIHLPAPVRRMYLSELHQILNPGGLIIGEFFSKEQFGKNTGGPQALDLLYDLDELLVDFKDLKINLGEKKNIKLKEGKLHVGEASVIRIIAKKE